MSPSYLDDAATAKSTPQSEPIPGSAQVENSAGGHAWEVDAMERLRRFLILGTEGGSYYAGERDLTKQALRGVREAITHMPADAIREIVDVSVGGRAPRNDEAIYALAIAASAKDDATRAKALAQINNVCRTGTHLFQFAKFVGAMRGHGRALNRALGDWYRQEPGHVAYQLVKYRQRDGVTHADLLRLAHPGRTVSSGNPTQANLTESHAALYDFIVDDEDPELGVVEQIDVFLLCQRAEKPEQTAALIRSATKPIPREFLRTEHLNDPDVNRALVERGMPMTALIRNLANLTRRTSWRRSIAFTLSFENVESTGKRHLLALDVSGSMGSPMSGGLLSCREGAAAMAMATARSGDPFHTVAFTGRDGQAVVGFDASAPRVLADFAAGRI
jgi:60 kDa SS-A/Ro ribonucleoprotein